jgi:hypothetical protein
LLVRLNLILPTLLSLGNSTPIKISLCSERTRRRLPELRVSIYPSRQNGLKWTERRLLPLTATQSSFLRDFAFFACQDTNYSCRKSKGGDDDILGDLGDLGKEVSALARKKKDAKKKGKPSELDLLEGSEGSKKIEINGVEHNLVDTDDVSEIEESYNPEKTDRDYLTDSDDMEEDPFEEEERKEREEAKKLQRRASRRASVANLNPEDIEGTESAFKKRSKDKDKKKDDGMLQMICRMWRLVAESVLN